ncbi:MAG TPA: hypothetical protein VKN99_03180 [Polyangia bacterium]|nr:hypothetical protein [Polyangia bacterium]
MGRWEEILAQAGGDVHAAARLLKSHGLHLTLARADPQGASVRVEILSLHDGLWAQIERRLGVAGLAARAAAVPVDRVAALEAALRARRAAYYPDPVAFVGAPLRERPALAALARRATDLFGLGGAVVAPVGEGGRAVLVAVGPAAGPELVAPFASWARGLVLD